MQPTTVCLFASLLSVAATVHAAADTPVWMIVVDSQAAPAGDGTLGAPYRTIAEGMQRAREIRLQSPDRIILRVRPGRYVENTPIYLNVSNFELRGSTQLTEDADGLPGNCGTEAIAAPCIEAGTETVVEPTVPLATRHVLLVIAPTRDGAADRITDVTVRGLLIDGKAANVAAGGTGIFVDRSDDFAIRGNITRRLLVGVLTRLSSGTIKGHFAHNSNDGLAISGGSGVYPSNVEAAGNRLVSNFAVGVVALGNGGVRARIEAPDVQPIQTLYDRIQHPEQVPDTLTLTLRDNDISRNRSFGVRLESFSANNSFYDTVDAQPMTAFIDADVRGNSIQDNGEYGLTIEGAFATRSNPRLFMGGFQGRFRDNSFLGNGRAALFVGFMLNGVVTRNPGLINSNKYLVDSTYEISIDEELGAIDYDNPLLDPFDRTTPLNNVLIINGASIVGTRVTCPPGFPCVPLGS